MVTSGNTRKNKIKTTAEHNCCACDYLCKTQDFPDWIITTAFYAAIHYIDLIIFPIEEDIKGKKVIFDSIDSYVHNYLRMFRNIEISKHEARQDLIQRKYPELFPAFKGLYDASTKARYTDYQAYTYDDALIFRKDLESIKNKT